MRGRFGTEQYMNTHVAGDLVVLLDPKNIQFININTSSLNMATTYRCVTSGDDINSVSDTSFTCRGVNMECLAPCDINGYVNTTNDWIISWIPRSRTPVETFSGLATPIGEASELYEIEIWNETFTVLKRTVTSLTSPTFTYTSAMQTTDFGVASKHVIGFRVYQVSALMARGYPASQLLDKFNNDDMYWNDVSMYLRFATDTQYIDIKGNVPTQNYGMSIATSDPWGTSLGSLYSNGTTGYLCYNYINPVNFGTADFTIDFWINLGINPTPASYPWIFSTGAWNGNTGIYCIATGPSTGWGGLGTMQIAMGTGVTGGVTVTTTTVMRSAGWKYVEYNRTGVKVRLFVDGILETLNTGASVANLPGGWMSFFTSGSSTGLSSTDLAYIRDFRITKNVARHLTNFTPPTFPSPTS